MSYLPHLMDSKFWSKAGMEKNRSEAELTASRCAGNEKMKTSAENKQSFQNCSGSTDDGNTWCKYKALKKKS